MQVNLSELEDRLWAAADDFRANSGLKASEYAAPVLGLIFLRFADVRFEAARERVGAKETKRRKIEPTRSLRCSVTSAVTRRIWKATPSV